MLDFRHETFLALCKIGSFTKTAQELHITQPAVSQHVKFLENLYGCKLFFYEGKSLKLTENGTILRNFAMTMSADSRKLQEDLQAKNGEKITVNFGATLTIGEYTMPPVLEKLMRAHPDLHITMVVDNTEILLGKLRGGDIDFALLEGFFDKTKYGYATISSQRFIPVCAKNSVFATKTRNFEEITAQRLILREKGSGTRDIFEQCLCKYNLTVDSFAHLCEIGNVSAIKQLVADGLGITFLYEAAVKEELKSGVLIEPDISGFSATRDFSFVYLKGSLHEKEYLKWYDIIKAAAQ